MATAIPILRIFDYNKTIEFYINWLGFSIDWEYKDESLPVYMQVSLNGVVLHLSEHYGDSSPGARVHINDFTNLKDYHQQLTSKNYKYYHPCVETAFYNPNVITMSVTDPFSNRLTFTEDVSATTVN